MYAVIESGGKQHRVELGSEIQVDRLDVQPGDSITLERVLLVADGEEAAIGQPVVDGAIVSAEVVDQRRGKKIVVFKYKPKARTRVKKGFRAELTTLRITDISFAGKSAAKLAEQVAKAEAKARREQEQAEQAAAAKAAEEQAAADKALAAKLASQTGEDEADGGTGKTQAAPKAGRKRTTTRKAVPETAAADEETPAAEDGPVPEATAEGAEPEADTEGDAATEKDG